MRLTRCESGANGHSPDGRNEAQLSNFKRAENGDISLSSTSSDHPDQSVYDDTDSTARRRALSHDVTAMNAARQSTVARNAHDTGVSDSGRWSTRRIAIYALFVALAIVTSFVEFPLIPVMPWLKYDPSGIVALIAGFAFGPSAAVIVSVLGFLPHLFITPWGALMAAIVALGLSVPAALIYKYHRSQRGAILGLMVGAACALIVAILGNLVITPLYAHMSVEQVAALIVPALLPFNLLKFAIDGVATYFIYKPISNLLHR